MKTILKIFKKDVIGLTRNIMALTIAIGLCIIPSLYAWFNIYSNWDPYANTALLKVAIVSCDEGYVDKNGTSVNMGDKIVDQLHDNDKLGWLFCDTTDQALEGVYSGEYYAAIIIGEDFSRSLYDFLENGFKHPSVTYYENSKKNAVASKITDTGMSTLQQNINKEFINVVASTAIEGLNKLSDMDSGKMEELISDIESVNDNLIGYGNSIDTFVATNESLAQNLLKIKDTLPEVQSVIDSTVTTANTTQITVSDTVSTLTTQMNTVLDVMTQKATSMKNHLEKAGEIAITDTEAASAEITAAVDDISAIMDQNIIIQDSLERLSKLDGLNLGIIDKIKSDLNTISVIEQMAKGLMERSSQIIGDSPLLIEAKYQLIKPVLEQCVDKITTVNDTIQNIVSKDMQQLEKDITQSVANLTEQLSLAGGNLTGMEQLLLGASNIVLTANDSLGDTQEVINKISKKITAITESLSEVEDGDLYQSLSKLLQADSSSYAEFISEPVEVEQINVYKAVNYGTSVTPFYTTLALWVGGIILVAIIKVHADYDSDLIKNAKLHELYFGRFILFFVMGQIQSAIIVFGDLYLLKIQCDNPKLLFITAAIASMVFTLLIYTLVISFGDVGKAIAVVMVVIQIAGSSGTYPIELLPEFFQKVYLYFPFPYAINAMREAISGRYKDDYFVYISFLLLFMVVALLIGLLIRKPFMGVNHFMEKRMKDTDMM